MNEIAEEEQYRYASRPWMGPPWESTAAKQSRRQQRRTKWKQHVIKMLIKLARTRGIDCRTLQKESKRC